MKILPLYFILFTLLTGCNNQIFKDIEKNNNITYYLASGIKLKISENNIATVFGFNECPIIDYPFGAKLSNSYCVKLIDNQYSKVRIINQDGSITISKLHATYKGNKIYITHNGYQVIETK